MELHKFLTSNRLFASVICVGMGGISGRKRNPRIPVNSANVSKRSQALFLHEPRTEQEVVCLFGALLADLGLVIERVQTPFPDCIVRRKRKNDEVLLERISDA